MEIRLKLKLKYAAPRAGSSGATVQPPAILRNFDARLRLPGDRMAMYS